MSERIRGKFVIAYPSCCRITRVTETEVWMVIVCGSKRVAGREVMVPKTMLQASVALGQERIVSTQPKWVAQVLAEQTGTQSDLEEALNTQGEAEGKKRSTVIKKGKARD